MTITSRWLYIVGGTLVVLSTSVNAQPYFPYSGPYYSYSNPYVMPYWRPDFGAWNSPQNRGYLPPPDHFDAPGVPYFRGPSPEDRDFWSRRPQAYRDGWGFRNPYTGGYGTEPWMLPPAAFMPPYGAMPYGARPQIGYPGPYPGPYPGVVNGFSPAQPPSNLCH